jgi:hypothetical protein
MREGCACARGVAGCTRGYPRRRGRGGWMRSGRGAGEVGGLEYGRGRLAARRRQFALDGSHEAYARRGWIPPSSIRGHGVRAPRPILFLPLSFSFASRTSYFPHPIFFPYSYNTSVGSSEIRRPSNRSLSPTWRGSLRAGSRNTMCVLSLSSLLRLGGGNEIGGRV